MKTSYLAKEKRRLHPFFFAGGLFFYLVALLRFDPDIHHDGIMFTPAIAFAEGKFPHRDFFAYYGPVSPMLQGIFLRLFGYEVLNLRLLSAIILTFTYLLVFKYLKTHTSTVWAYVITLITVAPVASILPWSSLISTLVNLIALLILSKINDQNSKFNRQFIVFVSSFLIAFAFYIRIHEFFVWLSVGIYLLAKERRLIRPWIIGFVSAHGLVLAFLQLNHALIAFLKDCILYPSSVAIIDDYTLSFFVGLGWYPFLTLVVFATLLLLKVLKFEGTVVRLFAITASVVLGYFFFRISSLPRGENATYRNPIIVFIDGTWMLNVIVGYFSATMSLILLLYLGLRKAPQFKYLHRLEIDARTNQALVMSLSFAVGVLPQLYPMYDRLHLWMLTPSLALPAGILLSQLFSKNVQFTFPLILLCTVIVSLQIFTNYSYMSKEREWSKPSIFRGMMATEEIESRTAPTIFMLQKYRDDKLSFDCNYGLYAASSGRFMSIDKYFVNWKGLYTIDERKRSNLIFICDLTPSQFDLYYSKKQVIEYQVETYLYNSRCIIRYNAVVRDDNGNI